MFKLPPPVHVKPVPKKNPQKPFRVLTSTENLKLIEEKEKRSPRKKKEKEQEMKKLRMHSKTKLKKAEPDLSPLCVHVWCNNYNAGVHVYIFLHYTHSKHALSILICPTCSNLTGSCSLPCHLLQEIYAHTHASDVILIFILQKLICCFNRPAQSTFT